MIEPQPSEKDSIRRRPWLLQTFGLAFGLGVLMVVIVVVAVLALESPSNRRTAVRAAPVAATTVPPAGEADVRPEQTGAEEPTAVVEPTRMPGGKLALASAPTPETSIINLPLVANLGQRASAQSPGRTPVPTAAATRAATPQPTTIARSAARSAAPTRTAARATIQSAPVRLRATTNPVLPLDLFFYVKAYCHKAGESLQVVDIFLTGHGGVPPYDYYNDTTFIGRDSGMVRFTMKAASGNPVPYKIIVLDSRGQRYTNEFFYKTGLHCK